jgi:hypothetical protein
VLSVVSKRALAELSRLRGLLDGSVDPEPVAGKTDGGSRREAALRVVDRLGSLFADLYEVGVASEAAELHRSGAGELLEEPGAEKAPKPERQPFGFAAGRKAA